MSVTSVAGSACTFKISSTAYSAQVTGYTINDTANIARTKTLSDVAYPKTDAQTDLSLDFVFDDETGLTGALRTALGAGTGLSLESAVGDAKYTGTWYVTSLSVTVAADGVATASASFVGELATFADVS